MLIHSDPNNMNSIVYHLIIERYSMKTLHWYFPWATALHLYNMTGWGEKLQQLHCYHPFSDSLDIYLTKNHYENYSPKMVPIAKIWGSGSWTNCSVHENPWAQQQCCTDTIAWSPNATYKSPGRPIISPCMVRWATSKFARDTLFVVWLNIMNALVR